PAADPRAHATHLGRRFRIVRRGECRFAGVEAVDPRSLLRSGHARFGPGPADICDAPERWRLAGWLGGVSPPTRQIPNIRLETRRRGRRLSSRRDASAPPLSTKLFVDIHEKLRMIGCVP